MRLRLSLGVVALLGCALGCQSQSAEVFSRRLSVGPASENGFTLDFQFHVANSGSGVLAVNEVNYRLMVAGTEVLHDKYPTALRIGTSGPVTVLAHVTWDGLLPAIDAIGKSGGDVDVALEGKASEVPLDYRGRLALRQLLATPEVAANPSARRLAAAMGLKLIAPATTAATTRPDTP